jgi:protein-S-isoprenylcysteine O-methyltransferase Ste14
VGSGYAVWTKQGKIALGLFILTIAFALQIPNMVSGFWVDIFTAISIILFAVGIFVIIWKKNQKELITKEEETKIEPKNES